MRGRQILIEPRPAGGHAAALLIDGRLQDLLIDPEAADATPRPEAIHRAVAGRPMKGMRGLIVDLGSDRSGFLRTTHPPAAGARLLVQVATWAEAGKAPPVSPKLLFKGRNAILTPGAPGINIARGLRDADLRATLRALAQAAMAGAASDLGLILRSAAANASAPEVSAEIAALRAECDAVLAQAGHGAAACLRPAPGARAEALRDWREAGDSLLEGPAALADHGVWEEVAALRQPLAPLGAGSMAVQATRALTAVDVNTGGDLTPAAALKVNLAAARELPRQLRLRGVGGQVVIDFAPLAKPERARVEAALTAALRADGIETSLAGWTPLGHLELLRKRARRPLAG